MNDMDWGMDNLFDTNVAEINGEGFGFYIHNPDSSANTVLCSNEVSAAAWGSPTSIVRKQPPRDRALLESAADLVHTLPAGTPPTQLLIH